MLLAYSYIRDLQPFGMLMIQDTALRCIPDRARFVAKHKLIADEPRRDKKQKSLAMPVVLQGTASLSTLPVISSA